jgi:competence protein ComEA
MSITPEERRALLFLAFLLLTGSLVRLGQAVSPRWTPELGPLFPDRQDSASTGGPPPAAETPPETARAEAAPPEDGPAAVADEVAPPTPYRAGLLELNAATAQDLATLPGIGEKLASRIVSDREANGPFARVEDLERVPGIGPAKLARLRDGLFVATGRTRH